MTDTFKLWISVTDVYLFVYINAWKGCDATSKFIICSDLLHGNNTFTVRFLFLFFLPKQYIVAKMITAWIDLLEEVKDNSSLG